MLAKLGRSAATILLLAFATGLLAAADDDPPMVWRVYPIQYLGLEQGRLLLEEKFPDILNTDNRVETKHMPQRPQESDSPNGYLAVLGTLELHEGIADVLARYDVPPRTLLFQVHLLQASMGAGNDPELPAQARSALDDIKAFLPFKGYALVDSAMVRTSSASHVDLSDEFQVRFNFRGHRQPDRPIIMEAFSLIESTAGEAGPVRREILETTFSMNLGETVVVGTSKLNGGDEALVVLLTATE